MPETHFEPAHIIATTGWTTTNLSNAMDAQQVDTATYDLVSLLIGVNNQYQGLPLEAYEVEFSQLLQRAVNLTGGDPSKVFVVSIPDYGYANGQANQASISQDLALFNATCSTSAAQSDIAHYNITGISQQWPSVQGWVAPDGLHPSGQQYAAWVASFAAQVEATVAGLTLGDAVAPVARKNADVPPDFFAPEERHFLHRHFPEQVALRPEAGL